DKYRGVLLPALKNDLRRRGMTKGKNKIRLWLVAGKVAGGDRNEEEIKNLFKKKKWDFMGPKTLRENLKNIVVKDKNVWDDNVTHVVTKLLIGE
ncbi:MAG: hypothetical protein ACREL1_01605, partial [bacterium]